MWLSFFTALPAVSMTIDGEDVDFAVDPEAGLQATGKFLDIPPGESVVVVLELAGPLDLSAGYHLSVRAPAVAVTMPIVVEIAGAPRKVRTDASTTSFTLDRIEP